jgi:hypothetical protein
VESKPDVGHRWPEEEPTQRIAARPSRYQRVIKFLGGAFLLGGVDRNFATPRNQASAPNVIGIDISGELSREDKDGTPSDDR